MPGMLRSNAGRIDVSHPFKNISGPVAEATHTFTSEETDWGFQYLIKIKEINDPRAGWIHPDLGHITIKVGSRSSRGYYDGCRFVSVAVLMGE